VYGQNLGDLPPNAVLVTPTKALFVEMLTRDITLEQAIMDLVDNSIDGARRLRDDGPLDGLIILLFLDADKFHISDNCGGIPVGDAREKAFRFGRLRGAKRKAHQVGQFGVGMKRAVFKFGHYFSIASTTPTDTFTLDVDVDVWENEDTPWLFEFDDYQQGMNNDLAVTGTDVLVLRLRPEAKKRFRSPVFINAVVRSIEQKQQQYIERGLRIECNGEPLLALSWLVVSGLGIVPGYREATVPGANGGEVTVRVCVGVADSNPAEAGWYVACNGRIVLSADQTDKTAWDKVTDTAKAPKYHNQFSRFRGYVFFESDDPSLLPWNTTKNDVDIDSDVYQNALLDMVEMMRPVIDFLNVLDAELDQATTPLLDIVEAAPKVRVQTVTVQGPFKYPPRIPSPPQARVSYARDRERVVALKRALHVDSYKDVGIQTFERAYNQLVGDDA
jgi:Histidine kinase-, DNA gyrase B-, and HSP90-like ATPase